MFRKSIQRAVAPFVAAFALAVLPPVVQAQAPVEVSFSYPVAVGGPITKIIDGLAADFEKENPGIKLKPIYTGTYQDSLTKTLTAVKGGDPPVTAILLSTDMFTLIDEDAIVPFAKAELSTHDNQRVTQALNGGVQAALTGTKTPEQAMKDAQREAERLLRSHQ
jgi:sn-glycerol 3-phosphate transport system substrate-binding protein